MASLHHVDLGGAGKPPLVLLHGLLGSSRNWQTAGRELAAHWHVHVLDARNHGKSPHEPVMDYAVLVADVVDWLGQQGLARVHVVGHSMGGKTAMKLACRHPELVARLVVLDIAPKDYTWAAHRAEFAAMAELDLEHLESRAEAELRFEARVPNLGTRKFLATNLERRAAGGWRWAINLPVLAAALPVLEANSLEPADRYAGPALFLRGGRSQYVQPEDETTIRRHFPAAKIETIAAAGHNPHMDARAEFVRRVQSFLGGD